MQDLDEGSATLNAENPLVSYRQPDGLILSTANLYFTSHDGDTAIVWRTAQSSKPGQEFLLWSEPHATFGDIVFAHVDGTWYGYFFKFELKTERISIMRVPLTGGEEAMVINQEPIEYVDVMNSHRNLVTDGVDLYWQDDHSVRKMPIGGGTITILDTTSLNKHTAGLSLRSNGSLIYASVADIVYVPTSGAITPPLARTIVHASSRVTTLQALADGVLWGEESGAVRRKIGSTTTTLESTSDMVPTSISFNGVDIAWTKCGSQSCQLWYDISVNQGSFAISADAHSLSFTSSDSGLVNLFWGDARGVHRIF
jgi:hypothetical protein